MNAYTRTRRLLPWLFIAAGAGLSFFGAREWFEARSGQWEAEREFERSLPVSAARPTERAPRAAPAPPAAGDAIAKLSIPRLSARMYVLEGIGRRQLRRGPAHMTGSALPGEDGNCIVAGHRDTHFRVLKDIRKGDDIAMETSRGTFVYRVTGLSVVSEIQTAALRDTPDAELHLITCYPFYYAGHAPKRFIVQARLRAAPE